MGNSGTMDDPKLGPQSKAAVLRAMQRFALEQSVEESVNVNPESESTGRQTCHGLRKPKSQGKQLLRQLAAYRLLKAPEDPGAARPHPKPAPESARRPSLPSSLSPPLFLTHGRHGTGGWSRSAGGRQ